MCVGAHVRDAPDRLLRPLLDPLWARPLRRLRQHLDRARERGVPASRTALSAAACTPHLYLPDAGRCFEPGVYEGTATSSAG